jgi:hypothetical protein
MHKIEKLSKFDHVRLSDFLNYVNYPKFHLFPNVNDVNTRSYLLELIKNSYKDSAIFSYSINSEIIALAIVKILDWDSKHFGYTCASINNIFFNKTKDYELLDQAMKKLFCEIEKDAILNNIKFMSVSVNSDDHLVSSALQSNNFKYILTWVDGFYNSKEKIQLRKNNAEVGIIKKSEIEYFKNIASGYYFKGGRFYIDKNFDISLVDRMYSNLITSSYDNNDIMLSYRIDGKPAGLFVCKKIVEYSHFDKLRVAPLRYLIIDPEVRNKHIGCELFASTINYLLDSCDIITTGLEVHNLPSLNLHIKLNFKINFTHNVFHWWSAKP